MQVTQHTGTDMNVSVNPGTALISTGTYPTSYSYEVAIDTSGGETVAIATAPTSNSRIDAIVGYIDTTVTPNTSPVNNANRIFKLFDVQGTVAASPSAPNAAAIQSAIGAANPYTILAYVTVGTNVTQIVNSNIADQRSFATQNTPSGLTGWVPANETHAYASPTTITAPTDATTKYDVGDLYMMTQSGTTKVFVITAITSTVLTVTGLAGVTVANATISQPYYSKERNPHGSGLKGASPFNPYKFSAYNSVATTIAAGSSPTKVALQTKIYDTSTNFDATTNYRFTVPIAGFYQFNGGVQLFVTNTVLVFAFLYKNGGLLRTGTTGMNASGGANNIASFAGGSFQLAANDYIELWASSSQASTSNTNTGLASTYLDGYFVSAT